MTDADQAPPEKCVCQFDPDLGEFGGYRTNGCPIHELGPNNPVSRKAPPEGERALPNTERRTIKWLREWADRELTGTLCNHEAHLGYIAARQMEALLDRVAAPAPPADDSWGGHGTIKAAPPAAGGLDLNAAIRAFNVVSDDMAGDGFILSTENATHRRALAAAVEAARPAPPKLATCVECGASEEAQAHVLDHDFVGEPTPRGPAGVRAERETLPEASSAAGDGSKVAGAPSAGAAPGPEPSGFRGVLRACPRCNGFQTIGDRICDECGGTGEADPEPGELIANISCPCCGAHLRVAHGDDEGEIAVEGRAVDHVAPAAAGEPSVSASKLRQVLESGFDCEGYRLTLRALITEAEARTPAAPSAEREGLLSDLDGLIEAGDGYTLEADDYDLLVKLRAALRARPGEGI